MPVLIGPRANVRVTCDTSPSNDRSESALAANPLDPYNVVGSSKRLTDPQTNAFSLAAYATFDGGQAWTEAARRSGCWPAWDGVPGPAVAFDDVGNAYLVALPFQGATPMAIAVYKSTDGGVTWSAPNLIHSAAGDVKQSAAGDTNPASPHHGNVYAAWDGAGGPLFGRTTDHGATWTGTGANPVGSSLTPASFAPQVVVAVDGTVYIFFMDFRTSSSSSPPTAAVRSARRRRSLKGSPGFRVNCRAVPSAPRRSRPLGQARTRTTCSSPGPTIAQALPVEGIFVKSAEVARWVGQPLGDQGVALAVTGGGTTGRT
jgi:hypothetical protein